MAQKIIKIGSSAGITIPKAELEKLGLTVGDEVSVSWDKTQGAFIVETAQGGVDKDTVDWTRKFIDTYRPALEELAKK